MYTSVQFHSASRCLKLPSYQMWQKYAHAKDLDWLTHGKNSVTMNLFSIENAHLFPELIVGVVKWIFYYKEWILMLTDPFPANMSDIEYFVIKSDVIKSFDCI